MPSRQATASASRYTNGRMRLRREQADILAEALSLEIATTIAARSVARETGNGPLTAYNQRLAGLRAMTEELARLSAEMGWSSNAPVDLRIMVGDHDVTDLARFIVTEI